MTMELTIHMESGLMRVEAMGEFSLPEAKRTFLEMLEAIEMHKARRVLLDGRKIQGKPETVERFYYGKFAAEQAGRGEVSRVTHFAYVLKEPVLDPQKLGETVARNRGMFVKAFDNPEEALAWLEIPSDAGAGKAP